MDFITQSLMAAGGVPLDNAWQSVNTTPDSFNSVCYDGTYYYVCGTSYYIGTYIAKYESNGELIWGKSIAYGTSGIRLEGKSITVDANAIYFVSTPRNALNACIHKYDLNGNKIFEKLVQFPSFRKMELTSIAICSTFFVCAGYVESSTIGSYDIFVFKYDLSGNVIWRKLYGTASADYCYDICIDTANSNEIYFCGSTVYSSKTNALVVKTDSDGNILWSNATLHSANGPDVARGISVTTYSGTTAGFVVGNTYNTSTSKNEGLINYVSGTGITATRRKIVESNGIVLNDVSMWFDPVGYQCRISGYIQTSPTKGFVCKYDDNSFYRGGKSFASTYDFSMGKLDGPYLLTSFAGTNTQAGILFSLPNDQHEDGISATWGPTTMAVPTITDTTAATTVTTGLVSTTSASVSTSDLTTSQVYNVEITTSACYNYSNKI